ncbi:MAG: hypothetical protein PHW02_07395 [bacterium]|nr:hypothetical protein [bacterium]
MLKFLILVFFLENSSVIPAGSDTFDMIEETSNKKFEIVVRNEDSLFFINVSDKNLTYIENLSVKNDTFYLERRFIRIGFLKVDLIYSPKRLRMVLPFSDSTSWTYQGTENGPGYKKHIESKGFMKLEKGNVYIYNVSARGGNEDTSTVVFDKDYSLQEITIQIPSILGLYKLLGFKSEKLILRRTDDFGL